jgi:sulfide:quinone oxidoreductase
MARARPREKVSAMERRPHHDHEPLRVVVAGGGVAGLETLVALRGLAGAATALTLVSPEDDFGVRALDVFEPFGLGKSRRYPLAELAADLDAGRHRDAVVRVEAGDRLLHLRSGAVLEYDVLVLALGASPYPAYEHGVCFDRAHEPDAFDELLADVRAEFAGHVAIVIPPGSAWTLPGYELALMVAAFEGVGRPNPPRITLITPEHEPLSAFGPPASAMAREELATAGVELLAGAHADVPSATIVRVAGTRRLRCDRVVHLPLLAGPNVDGIPCDAAGFMLVDERFRVTGEDAVFAVGDGTAGPYKQGGLAAQQADVVAGQIAELAGADHVARPYQPVLRGLLRTAHGPRYLRAEPPGGGGSAEVSEQCLWWPPSKVASRWLTPWLAARDLEGRPAPATRRLPSGGISSVVDAPGP